MRLLLPLVAIFTACKGGGPKVSQKPAEKPAERKVETPVERPIETPAGPAVNAAPEIRVSKFDLSALPRGLDLLGEPVGAWSWKDSDGENLLVLTAVAEHPMTSKDPDLRGAELYGYQLSREGGQPWSELWKIQDFVKSCPNDITAAHLTDSVTVTDLDADGQAESAWIYRTACRGDVSPATQKLMMHEGATKYAIRGEAIIVAGSERYGGTSTPDAAFKSAPPSFLSSAQALWGKFDAETF